MSARPRTSVLMPAYNAEATIRESVASVLAQTVADLELVVDDGSAVPVDDAWEREYVEPILPCLADPGIGRRTPTRRRSVIPSTSRAAGRLS
jgi:glycosyltransferase involved in cell wall biosynthesis